MSEQNSLIEHTGQRHQLFKYIPTENLDIKEKKEDMKGQTLLLGNKSNIFPNYVAMYLQMMIN